MSTKVQDKVDPSSIPLTSWLPITMKDARKKGWDELDVILITGDAYVDHPAFGSAVIGRIIESYGFKIAIIPQPNWQDDLRDFKKFGKPKLFFGVTAGNMDSMVNKYTAGKRKREQDAYTPGGDTNFRPDNASVVYTKILKDLYPDVPIVLGGVEGSLRRVTHYNYWEGELQPNILTQSGADLLIYGMGEQPLRDILSLLKKGVPFESLKTVPQTGFLINKGDDLPKNKRWKSFKLNSHEDCLESKKRFALNFRFVETESNKQNARRLFQHVGDKTLVINPPYKVMTEKEVDRSFDLPYTRLPHPKYKNRGAISAFEMIKFSVNMHRGCFGGCSFCTISAHQGKLVASRSKASIMKEVDQITKMGDFKGYLSDLGGPSANMYQMKGIDQDMCDGCSLPSCIFPTICTNLDTDPSKMLEIYREVNAKVEVKKAFVSSGLRYDLMLDKKSTHKKTDAEYVEQLITHHVSGRLKVAPEHTEDRVLDMMRKPSFKIFGEFKQRFDEICSRKGLKQELIPYFISSHPACEPEDMANLAAKTKKLGYRLEQIQDFTPTPMTLATVIYYSGYNPYNMQKVRTATSYDEKAKQRKFFFWYKEENKNFIKNHLGALKRFDITKDLFG
jgi:uncharacterized radical SAM protein YgiQ